MLQLVSIVSQTNHCVAQGSLALDLVSSIDSQYIIEDSSYLPLSFFCYGEETQLSQPFLGCQGLWLSS